ncbi:unnamed protein product [Rotaria magnacalcarata]
MKIQSRLRCRITTPDQFLFYHPDGERYGLCDLRTLSSSSTKFRGVRLHQMNQEAIDERKTISCDENTIGSPINIESTTTTSKIFEGKQQSVEDHIPIILEIDRCTNINDENDEEDE